MNQNDMMVKLELTPRSIIRLILLKDIYLLLLTLFSFVYGRTHLFFTFLGIIFLFMLFDSVIALCVSRHKLEETINKFGKRQFKQFFNNLSLYIGYDQEVKTNAKS